jgi:hypothetical protein
LPLGYIFSAFMISMMLGSIIYTTIATAYKPPSNDSSLPTNSSDESATQSAARSNSDPLVILHAKLAAIICGIAALLFAYSATGSKLAVENRFWAFCLFEACVGAYYPVMGMLRGTLVPNEVRATVCVVSPFSFPLFSSFPLCFPAFSICPSRPFTSPLLLNYRHDQISLTFRRLLQLSSLFRMPLNIFVTVALLTGVSSARHLVFTGCAVLLALAAVACALILVRRGEDHGVATASHSESAPVDNEERTYTD